MGTPTVRLANIRDLSDAGPGLSSGVAYRSDAPLPGDEPPTGIAAWPPSTVVDLRGGGEKHDAHPLAGSARIVEIDLLAAANLAGGSSHTLGSLEELYALMIGPGAAPGLVDVVAQVARADAPVLVHCSAGKDRTGVSAALVLSLVGVDRDRVVADYRATEKHMAGVLGRMLGGRPISIGETPLASVPQEVLEAPAAAIETVLDAWDAHDGGVEGWYLAHGGDDDTLAELKRRLLA